MIINELLEELHPHPSLLPGSPLDRAEARAWIVSANDVLFAASYRTMLAVAGGAAGRAARQADGRGPGRRVVEGWGEPAARLASAYPAVAAWADAVLARPAVRAAEPADFSVRTRRSFEERAAKLRAAG